MESSMSKRMEKRSCEEDEAAASDRMPESKKQKLPSLASVIVEALKVDSMQRLCSSLEPLLRRIVSEEVERALMKLEPKKLDGRMSPPRIRGLEGQNLQLHFKTRMPPHLFTGGKVEGEQGAIIHVVLLDSNKGSIVQKGPESSAKLSVLVLEGDFNEEVDDDWTEEHFESQEVKERGGKGPILTGDLQVTLKGGVGMLGDLTFTDNSSWIRSRKFRLGVKVVSGGCEGVRVREGKTEAFAVKDHRGELYKKHYPPALHDAVWRLDRIAKDGALHKKLRTAQVVTVEDFLRLLVKDPQRLRSILGSGMSNRMWENTVEHAKTCVLGGKLYVYYADETHSMGVVFNHIYEVRGLIADGQFIPLESLTQNQKISVDYLVTRAYNSWQQVVEYDGEILNSIATDNQTVEASTTVITNQDYSLDHYNKTPQTQHQYISNHYVSERGPFFQPSRDQQPVQKLIELPFVISSQSDYGSVEGAHSSEEWPRPRSGPGGPGMEEYIAEQIRERSSEMLGSDEMQRLLLKTFNMGAESQYGYSNEPSNCYDMLYEARMDQSFDHEQVHGRSSGKAVVGWLKLKAALRWGIFVRKRVAERRAQITELD